MHLKANLTKETFLPLKLELYINNEHELMYLFMMFNCNSNKFDKTGFKKEYKPEEVMDVMLAFGTLREICRMTGVRW